MKHIQRKFLFQDNFNENITQEKYSLTLIPKQDLKTKNWNFLKEHKDNPIVIKTDMDENLFSFAFNNHGETVIIPLPDFTLVYYDFAYNLNRNRKEVFKEAMSKLNNIETITEGVAEKMYSLYGYSTSCIINLFTSIESFINSLIPTDYIYKVNSNRKTELYDYNQIQKSISYDDKIKKILPEIYGKNFFKTTSKSTAHLENLKKIRDEIVHTKNDNRGEIHIKLLKDILNFKYDETLVSTRNFMNFFKPNYAIDCKCDNEF